MKIDFARLNHILIPKGKEDRDRFRESRFGRIVIPLVGALLGLAHRRRTLAHRGDVPRRRRERRCPQHHGLRLLLAAGRSHRRVARGSFPPSPRRCRARRRCAATRHRRRARHLHDRLHARARGRCSVAIQCASAGPSCRGTARGSTRRPPRSSSRKAARRRPRCARSSSRAGSIISIRSPRQPWLPAGSRAVHVADRRGEAPRRAARRERRSTPVHRGGEASARRRRARIEERRGDGPPRSPAVSTGRSGARSPRAELGAHGHSRRSRVPAGVLHARRRRARHRHRATPSASRPRSSSPPASSRICRAVRRSSTCSSSATPSTSSRSGAASARSIRRSSSSPPSSAARRSHASQLLGRLEPYLGRLSTVVVIALERAQERTAARARHQRPRHRCTTLLVDDDLARRSASGKSSLGRLAMTCALSPPPERARGAFALVPTARGGAGPRADRGDDAAAGGRPGHRHRARLVSSVVVALVPKRDDVRTHGSVTAAIVAVARDRPGAAPAPPLRDRRRALFAFVVVACFRAPLVGARLRAAEPSEGGRVRARPRRRVKAAMAVLALVTVAVTACARLRAAAPQRDRRAAGPAHAPATCSRRRPRSASATHIRVGSLRHMLRSNRVVMRIDGEPVEYLRGAVLDRYDLARVVEHAASNVVHRARATPEAAATHAHRALARGAHGSHAGAALVSPRRCVQPPHAVRSGRARSRSAPRIPIRRTMPGRSGSRVRTTARAPRRCRCRAAPNPSDLGIGREDPRRPRRPSPSNGRAARTSRPEALDAIVRELSRLSRIRSTIAARATSIRCSSSCKAVTADTASSLRRRWRSSPARSTIPTRLAVGYRVDEVNPITGHRRSFAIATRTRGSRPGSTAAGSRFDPTPIAEVHATTRARRAGRTSARRCRSRGIGPSASSRASASREPASSSASSRSRSIILRRFLQRRRTTTQRLTAASRPLPAFETLATALARAGLGAHARPSRSSASHVALDAAGEPWSTDVADALTRYAELRYGGIGEERTVAQRLDDARAQGRAGLSIRRSEYSRRFIQDALTCRRLLVEHRPQALLQLGRSPLRDHLGEEASLLRLRDGERAAQRALRCAVRVARVARRASRAARARRPPRRSRRRDRARAPPSRHRARPRAARARAPGPARGSDAHLERARREAKAERHLVQPDAHAVTRRHDANVTAQRQHAAAGDGMSVHPRHGRARDARRAPPRGPRGRPRNVAEAGLVERGDLLQVEPGRERIALAGQEDRGITGFANGRKRALHELGGERILPGPGEPNGLGHGAKCTGLFTR